jgi:hypothetical protein
MRRRLRRQQRVREALLLDLGALVYELHRHGRREPELLQEKAAELSAVDREVRALAEALDEGEGLTQLVAAGIAGGCEACGSLLTSDARFCSRCGAPTGPALAGERVPPEEVQPGLATAGNGASRSDEDPAELETGEHPAVEVEEPPAEETKVTEPPRTPGPPPWASEENRAQRGVRAGLRRWLSDRTRK